MASKLQHAAPAQDWTKQESEDAEGVVTFTYRTQPDSPPDVKTIQKQMAIVAWQPGANRMVDIPAEVHHQEHPVACCARAERSNAKFLYSEVECLSPVPDFIQQACNTCGDLEMMACC